MIEYDNKVAVLLSTYNGSAYLEEMLDSLQNQSYPHFVILIRDDGSSDSSLNIIRRFENQFRNKFKVVNSSSNVGIKKSYSILVEYALKNTDCDYFMFADQDDVWLPDKIKVSLEKIANMNMCYVGTPLLVHTDLKVTDKDLNEVSESFWNHQKLDPKKDSFNRLLVQNVITGCAMIMNRKLAEICLPIPQNAIMHDWWIGLVASAFGVIDYIALPTLLYRQHGANFLGARKFDLNYVLGNIKPRIRKFDLNYVLGNIKPRIMSEKYFLHENIIQAKAFYEVYLNKLTAEQKEILENFINLPNLNFFQKRAQIFKYSFYKVGLIRNIGLLTKL